MGLGLREPVTSLTACEDYAAFGCRSGSGSGSSLPLWCGSGCGFLFDADADPGYQNDADPRIHNTGNQWQIRKQGVWRGGGREVWRVILPSQEEVAATRAVWCSRVEGSSRAAFIDRYLQYKSIQQGRSDAPGWRAPAGPPLSTDICNTNALSVAVLSIEGCTYCSKCIK